MTAFAIEASPDDQRGCSHSLKPAKPIKLDAVIVNGAGKKADIQARIAQLSSMTGVAFGFCTCHYHRLRIGNFFFKCADRFSEQGNRPLLVL